MWVVTYAKIIDDKDNGIKLAGVYFGGVAADKEEAEKIARDCVNNIKGGTIMPRLHQSPNTCNLVHVMAEAETVFKKKESEMIMAASILTRPMKRK